MHATRQLGLCISSDDAGIPGSHSRRLLRELADRGHLELTSVFCFPPLAQSHSESGPALGIGAVHERATATNRSCTSRPRVADSPAFAHFSASKQRRESRCSATNRDPPSSSRGEGPPAAAAGQPSKCVHLDEGHPHLAKQVSDMMRTLAAPHRPGRLSVHSQVPALGLRNAEFKCNKSFALSQLNAGTTVSLRENRNCK